MHEGTVEESKEDLLVTQMSVGTVSTEMPPSVFVLTGSPAKEVAQPPLQAKVSLAIFRSCISLNRQVQVSKILREYWYI